MSEPTRNEKYERIREVYPLDRKPCAWCNSRKSHHYDCPVPDIHALLTDVAALTAQLAEAREETARHQRGAEALLREQAEIKAALGLAAGGTGRSLAEEVAAAQAEVTALREALATVGIRDAFRAGFLATVDGENGGWAFDGPSAADREPEAWGAWKVAGFPKAEAALGGQPPTGGQTT